MVAFVAVLFVVVLPATCSECDYTTIQPDVWIASVEDNVHFNCSSNLETSPTNPKWEINEFEVSLNNCPPPFTCDGSTLFIDVVDTKIKSIRCILQFHPDGPKYSNNATIEYTYTTKVRRDDDSFLLCQKENVIFSNQGDASIMYIGIEGSGNMCSRSVNFTKCDDPNIETEVFLSESLREKSMYFEINDVEMFYGHNVVVTINDNCDNCLESFYLPNMKPTVLRCIRSNYTGPVIDDLSNENGCDFDSPIINYVICIHSPSGKNECFESPCGNAHVYTSLCTENYQVHGKSASLDVNGVENGTVVSIYCVGFDCRGYINYVMLFNIKILTCEGDAECDQCLGKKVKDTAGNWEDCGETYDIYKCLEMSQNYTKDGVSCESLSGACQSYNKSTVCEYDRCTCESNGNGSFCAVPCKTYGINDVEHRWTCVCHENQNDNGKTCVRYTYQQSGEVKIIQLKLVIVFITVFLASIL